MRSRLQRDRAQHVIGGEQLVGRLVVMVANLQPRQMKFGRSEGMVVAAGTDGEVFLLSPDAGAREGQRLH